MEAAFHRTIKKVGEDIESLKMNTAIAALMALINDIAAKGSLTRDEFKTLIILLNPFAPHITEELWEMSGFEGALNAAKWPEYDEAKCKESEIEIVVQFMGKIKSRITVSADATKEELIALAKADEKMAEELKGKEIIKEICVPGKLVNIVAK